MQDIIGNFHDLIVIVLSYVFIDVPLARSFFDNNKYKKRNELLKFVLMFLSFVCLVIFYYQGLNVILEQLNIPPVSTTAVEVIYVKSVISFLLLNINKYKNKNINWIRHISIVTVLVLYIGLVYYYLYFAFFKKDYQTFKFILVTITGILLLSTKTKKPSELFGKSYKNKYKQQNLTVLN